MPRVLRGPNCPPGAAEREVERVMDCAREYGRWGHRDATMILVAYRHEADCENPLWGAARIHGELLKLGFEIAESTVSKYMIRRRGLARADVRPSDCPRR